MWERIRVIFTIPELRQKIFLTLFLLGIYRIGWQIPLPVIDQAAVNQFASQQTSGGFSRFVEYAAVFSGSRLQQATIFGLGIMPYISASIIFQLLGSVWKPLEDLQKEGESGRKKINEYTRYATVVLCLLQSMAYVRLYIMGSAGLVNEALISPSTGNLQFIWQITAVLMMTCGTIFLMWLGEQIDEFGIGNGISLLIMAGILAQMPSAGVQLLSDARMELVGLFNGEIGIEAMIVLAVSFVLVVAGVVFITLGQRRIPTQSAEHVRGRRVYGGARQYLPMRINQAGVMPIIFAGSLLMFPQIICTWLAQAFSVNEMLATGFSNLAEMFGSPTSLVYNLLYVGMIYFFCYFWTAIMFNPKDMSDNLKNMGTFIPGYRPGKRTGDYLEQVMVRITYVGAGFLALVAIIPSIIAGSLGVSFMVASFYGGTGLLIAVSVAFDLVQKIDSHLVMRNYRGLLESLPRCRCGLSRQTSVQLAVGGQGMRLLVFLGPPGVGKGTAAERIVTSLGFHWLSTGDKLREAQRSGSPFGQRVTEYIDAGRLVPDELIIEMVEGEMAKLDPSTCLLLDGFPRTLPQAIALDENLERHDQQVELVMELQADQEELVQRIRGRSQTEGRADDTLETLQQRLEEFQRQTAPLTDYYQNQGKLQVIDAMGSPDEVFERVRQCIGKYLAEDGDNVPHHQG